MCVSAPSVNQMVKMLERRGLIERQPGEARALRVLVPEDRLPPWNKGKAAHNPVPANPAKRFTETTAPRPSTAAKLYVLSVFLTAGPVSKKFANKVMSRVIEIRGD